MPPTQLNEKNNPAEYYKDGKNLIGIKKTTRFYISTDIAYLHSKPNLESKILIALEKGDCFIPIAVNGDTLVTDSISENWIEAKVKNLDGWIYKESVSEALVDLLTDADKNGILLENEKDYKRIKLEFEKEQPGIPFPEGSITCIPSIEERNIIKGCKKYKRYEINRSVEQRMKLEELDYYYTMILREEVYKYGDEYCSLLVDMVFAHCGGIGDIQW